jgi:hypothetical protein
MSKDIVARGESAADREERLAAERRIFDAAREHWGVLLRFSRECQRQYAPRSWEGRESRKRTRYYERQLRRVERSAAKLEKGGAA